MTSFVLSACGNNLDPIQPAPTALSDETYTEIDIPVGYGYVSRTIEVYFTDPLDPKSAFRRDGLDQILSSAIDEARFSLDLAVYSLDNYQISSAIIRAKKKGVSVRIVVEGDNIETQAIQNLIDNGIEVRNDGRSGLMHNKFMIIDRQEVWTGSMNYTYSGVYEDHNFLTCFHSPELVENYETEFLELILKKPGEPTPKQDLVIAGRDVVSMFSPDDRVAYRVVDLLNSANSSIQFMEYTFTADDYAEIMIEKAGGGLYVSGIMDEASVKAVGSEYALLTQSGIPIIRAEGPGLMHHKTVVIDDQIVIFGSYNFTAAAERKNDENMLILWDRELAKLFEQEFDRIANSQ